MSDDEKQYPRQKGHVSRISDFQLMNKLKSSKEWEVLERTMEPVWYMEKVK